VACPAVLAQALAARGGHGVSDGDTVTVLTRRPEGERQVKVRLHGVDCPETRQPFGTAPGSSPRDGLRQARRGARRDTDRYGRTSARCSPAASRSTRN
jgi:endonuclease YncB( thermonuclease family)